MFSRGNKVQAGVATDLVPIVPSDTTDLPEACWAIYVNTSGDIRIKTLRGTVVTLSAVPVGVLPVGAARVYTTGTTATALLAVY